MISILWTLAFMYVIYQRIDHMSYGKQGSKFNGLMINLSIILYIISIFLI